MSSTTSFGHRNRNARRRERSKAERKERLARELEAASNCDCPCSCMDCADNYDINGDLYHTDDCDFRCMCQDDYDPEPPSDWYPSADAVHAGHDERDNGPDCDDFGAYEPDYILPPERDEYYVEVPRLQLDLEVRQIQAERNAAQRAARTLQLAVPNLSDDHLERARATMVAARAFERRQNRVHDVVHVSVRDQVDETIRAEQQERNYHKHLSYYDTKPAREIPFGNQ